MADWVTHFHWLRPWWLLAIPIGLGLAMLWARHAYTAHAWSQIISPTLLPHLTQSHTQKTDRRRVAWALAGIWLLTCLGLAGPTATQLPQPLQRDANALVILLDLSPSMRVQDLVPDRLSRAHLKIIDFLHERQDGVTGLVIYAGDAFAVVPLTQDSNTLIHLIPTLEPEIMPAPGSHVEAALREGIELLMTGGHRAGRLLLVTDGVTSDAHQSVARLMRQFGEYSLDILGVGTRDGGPIPSPEGGFVRGANDRIHIAGLNVQPLHNLATGTGGRYATLSPDDRDLDHLLTPYRDASLDNPLEQTGRQFDLWHDLGYWFALFLLPVIVMNFRRGILTLAATLPLATTSPPATAFEWQDLWQRADQRAHRALTEGDAERAAELFRDPAWRGTAAYQAGAYDQAIEYFSADDSPRGDYNLGNALAASGNFAAAIAAYDEALAQDPDFSAARHNREQAERLLQQAEESPPDESPSQPSSQSPQDTPPENSDDSAADNAGQDENEQDGSQQQMDTGTSGDHSSSPPSDDYSDPSPRDTELEGTRDTAGAQGAEEDAASQQQDTSTSEESLSEAAPAEELVGHRDATPASAEDQRMEQWLRQVPDDPGGLLRRHLQREALLRARESSRAPSSPPGYEDKRW